MKKNKFVYTLLLSIILAGCSNVASWRPHGHTDYRSPDLVPWAPKEDPRLPASEAKILLVGQVTDQSMPPLGGLYQDTDFAESPLVEVYHLANSAELIASALPVKLAAAGFRSYRDASDLGDAVNADSVFPTGLLVLRLNLGSLTYARHVEGFDALLGDYQIDVFNADTNEKLYSFRSNFKIKLDWDMKAMVLPLDGFQVIAQSMVRDLLQDAGFMSKVRGT